MVRLALSAAFILAISLPPAIAAAPGPAGFPVAGPSVTTRHTPRPMMARLAVSPVGNVVQPRMRQIPIGDPRRFVPALPLGGPLYAAGGGRDLIILTPAVEPAHIPAIPVVAGIRPAPVAPPVIYAITRGAAAQGQMRRHARDRQAMLNHHAATRRMAPNARVVHLGDAQDAPVARIVQVRVR